MRRSLSVMFSLAALAPLQGQSPLAVLKLVPASAESVELTWRLAESNPRYLKAVTGIGAKDGLVSLEQLAHIGISDLASGTVATASFPEADATSAKPGKKAEKKAGNHSVSYFPIKDSKAFLARVHAKRVGNDWQYEWKSESAKERRYLAFRDGYALVSEQKNLLEAALKSGPGLDAELASLNAWMLEQDTVMLASAASTRRGLASLVDESGKGKTRNPLPSQLLGELGERARKSIHHVALGLKMPAEGGLVMQARAFFTPGSPMAVEAAAHAPLAGHPLGKLPETPFALALGGEWPQSLNAFNRMALQGTKLSEDDRKALTALVSKCQDQVQRMAFTFQAPARSGDPFLQGFCGMVDVKDAKAWMEANRSQITWMGEHMNGAYVYQADCLPELPSFTLEMDLSALAGDKIPSAQMAMVGGLLFGGSRCRISYGLLDDHTVLTVVGGADALKAFLTKVKDGKLLAARPTIQSVDAQLPKGASLAIYLDPKGFQDLVVSVLNSFAPGKTSEIKAIGAVAPLAAVVSMDPAGIQISGLARPESLEAMAQLFASVKSVMAPPAKPSPEGPESEGADVEDQDEDGGE